MIPKNYSYKDKCFKVFKLRCPKVFLLLISFTGNDGRLVHVSVFTLHLIPSGWPSQDVMTCINKTCHAFLIIKQAWHNWGNGFYVGVTTSHDILLS